MSTVLATECVVCRQPPEHPTECHCGAVYCKDCRDGHECAPIEPIVLRDYQDDLVRGVHRIIRGGQRRVLIVLPTGGGKRLVFAWWTDKAARQGKRALFVVNRRPLVRQFSDELRKRGIPHNISMSDETTPDRGEPVVVASIQTLRQRHFFHPDTGQRDGTGLPPADIIFVDEAHLDLSSYKALFDFYPDALVIGNTATPVGAGGKSLADVWPAMHIGSPKTELIRREFLVPTKMYAPGEPNMEGVRVTKANYNSAQAEERVRQCTVFANVFREWQPWSDLPTVVFAPGVEFARWLAKEWNRRGYSAVCVDAKTKPKERKRVFDGVNDDSIRVVVSVDVLKVGVDCPAWTVGIDLQPTMQLRDFVQKTGRVCRKHEGKHEAVWLDLSGAFWRHGHPDEDIAWDEIKGDETTADLVARARNKPEAPKPIACPKCKLVRKSGASCPQCGFEYAKQMRLVYMEDGRTKYMAPPRLGPKEKKAPVAKGTLEWQIKQWISAVCRAAQGRKTKSGKRITFTLKQARHMYFKETGEWPSYDLPENLMPREHSPDWDRKAGDVYEWATKRRAKA